jgi:hypothetical protein
MWIAPPYNDPRTFGRSVVCILFNCVWLLRSCENINLCMRRGSVIGIATAYGVGSPSPGKVKSFYLSISSRPAMGYTRPPVYYVPGTLSPEIRRQGREADHSPPTSVLVKKTWIYTLKLVVCILLRVLGHVQGFRLTQHWFEYFIQ